jgi:hypothetical protein
VIVDREVLAEGAGPTKKIAQRAAAALALERLRESHDDVPALAAPPAQPAPAGEAKGKPPLARRAAARPRRTPSSAAPGEPRKRARTRKTKPSAADAAAAGNAP